MTDTNILKKIKVTRAAVKLFCSVQLIYENAKLAQTEQTPPATKVILNKLRHDCGRLNKDFWSHLDSNAETVFQDKLRKIEKILEE